MLLPHKMYAADLKAGIFDMIDNEARGIMNNFISTSSSGNKTLILVTTGIHVSVTVG